ncbi:MAG: hypothetical protein R3302_02870 [Sulfurimonadaceae bacterium]|nr:hypothetical protein [Sulfurimonadaceae bacterium]
MNEPTLEKIDDYHKLSAEKGRVVWAVVIACLLIGGIYASAKAIYGTVNDEVPTSQMIGKVPVQ